MCPACSSRRRSRYRMASPLLAKVMPSIVVRRALYFEWKLELAVIIRWRRPDNLELTAKELQPDAKVECRGWTQGRLPHGKRSAVEAALVLEVPSRPSLALAFGAKRRDELVPERLVSDAAVASQGARSPWRSVLLSRGEAMSAASSTSGRWCVRHRLLAPHPRGERGAPLPCWRADGGGATTWLLNTAKMQSLASCTFAPMCAIAVHASRVGSTILTGAFT